MAIVKSKKIWWTPITGSDVTGYRVYVAPAGTAFATTLQNITVGAGVSFVVVPDAFPAGTFVEEADYTVWIVSIDDSGNESDPFVLTGHFDFQPPPKVAEAGISDL